MFDYRIPEQSLPGIKDSRYSKTIAEKTVTLSYQLQLTSRRVHPIWSTRFRAVEFPSYLSDQLAHIPNQELHL